jgi:hypothetical protein
MSRCPVCHTTTANSLHINTATRTALVCSPLCGAIIQALTLANGARP